MSMETQEARTTDDFRSELAVIYNEALTEHMQKPFTTEQWQAVTRRITVAFAQAAIDFRGDPQLKEIVKAADAKYSAEAYPDGSAVFSMAGLHADFGLDATLEAGRIRLAVNARVLDSSEEQ